MIFRSKQSWHFTQKHVTLCNFLQKKQVKLALTTFARSILYLKSSSQWTLLRKDILSLTYNLVYQIKFIDNGKKKLTKTLWKIWVPCPYYMKIFEFFANFGSTKKSQNLSCVNNECRKHKMMWKLSDSHVHNQERMSLWPLKRLQITFFYFSDECSV